jgi:hypothetical protein
MTPTLWIYLHDLGITLVTVILHAAGVWGASA